MFLCTLHMGLLCPLLHPWYVIIIPMCNVHPYFSLKSLGKEVHVKHGKNTVSLFPRPASQTAAPLPRQPPLATPWMHARCTRWGQGRFTVLTENNTIVNNNKRINCVLHTHFVCLNNSILFVHRLLYLTSPTWVPLSSHTSTLFLWLHSICGTLYFPKMATSLHPTPYPHMFLQCQHSCQEAMGFVFPHC